MRGGGAKQLDSTREEGKILLPPNNRQVILLDNKVQAMARLKGAIRVAFVRNCEINCAVLTERLCGHFVEACSKTEFFNMLFLNGTSITVDDTHQLESATLQVSQYFVQSFYSWTLSSAYVKFRRPFESHPNLCEQS